MTKADETSQASIDPLEELPVGGLLGFVYQETGEARLRECTDMLINPDEGEPANRGFLERAAAELEAVGLDHIWKIIRDAAQAAPEVTDRPNTDSRADYQDGFRSRHNRFPTPEETPKGLS